MNLKELMLSGIEHLIISIPKNEIIQRDTLKTLNILNQLLADKEVTRFYQERVEISFDGYDDSTAEVWEIQPIRDFVKELDEEFPFWLFFMSKNGGGLFAILRCFLLPSLKPEAEVKYNGPRLQKYLENRGFPAMNQICDYLELPEEDNIALTEGLMDYLDRI
jgi:hypothetical protein